MIISERIIYDQVVLELKFDFMKKNIKIWNICVALYFDCNEQNEGLIPFFWQE